jgi:hypothetical protein
MVDVDEMFTFIKDPSYVIVGDGEDAFASLTKFVEVR